MKIKKGFVMREVMGQTVVVALGEASKSFHGMIKMNKFAAEIWKGIEAGLTVDQIADSFVEKYADVTKEQALKDIDAIVSKMVNAGIME